MSELFKDLSGMSKESVNAEAKIELSTDEKVKRLLDFISDTDGMTHDEIKKELIGDGVDVDAFNERCFNIINKEKLRRYEQENKALKEALQAFVDELGTNSDLHRFKDEIETAKKLLESK